MSERACAAGAPTLTARVLTRPPRVCNFAASFTRLQREANQAATEATEAAQARATAWDRSDRGAFASERRWGSKRTAVRRHDSGIWSWATGGASSVRR